MGVDLCSLGNHKIDFRGREFKELAEEIKSKLDNIQFVNADYLRAWALYVEKSNSKNVFSIRSIKNTKCWSYREDLGKYYNFKKDKYIEFEGPFDLELTFYQNYIHLWNPSDRYYRWFSYSHKLEKKLYINEWRKYLHQVVHTFGGDRVIYLPDNGNPLEEYFDFEGTFEEMESDLIKNYGRPKSTFREMAKDFNKEINSSYFIDYLNDINWKRKTDINQYLPEPDDTSDINFDLSKYTSKEKLISIKFDYKTLVHRRKGKKYEFYHLAVYKGLLLKHTGIVGGEENLEVILDKYAPFKYFEIEKELESEGYSNKIKKYYEIRYFRDYKKFCWGQALEKMEKELLWSGNGVIGGGVSYSNRTIELKNFYAVDEKLVINKLLDIGRENFIKDLVEISRQYKSGKSKLIYKGNGF